MDGGRPGRAAARTIPGEEGRADGGLVEQGPNGDGFAGPDNHAHVGQERTEQGVQTDPNTGDTVFFYQRADGYDGELTTRYVTEVRHAPNGTVTVLEYHQS